MIEEKEYKFYTCKYDMAFKEVFLNEKNKDLLKALLESILKININKIEIGNNERNVGNVHVRRKYLDAILYTDQGIIGIEVNTSREDYVRPRNFSFISDVYFHYIEVGENYSEQMNVIQINLSYNLDYKDLVRVFKIRDDNNNLYVKNFTIYEFNMDKYVEFWYTKDKEKIEEYKYLIMLNLNSEELKELSKKDKVVSKYMDQLELINKLPRYRGFISEEEDNRKIMNSLKKQYIEEGLEEGKKEGMKEGIKQGIKEGIKETAKAMLYKNIDINTISDCTGLSKDEISKLK